jgi:hypothetical protein
MKRSGIAASMAKQSELVGLRHKITMTGLLALCGLALLVQHIAGRDPNFRGGHLIAGVLMLALALIVWFLPSEPNRE